MCYRETLDTNESTHLIIRRRKVKEAEQGWKQASQPGPTLSLNLLHLINESWLFRITTHSESRPNRLLFLSIR